MLTTGAELITLFAEVIVRRKVHTESDRSSPRTTSRAASDLLIT